MERSIEIVARGVCIVDGEVLLCHSKGAKNTFLPGGHVEFDERAQVALERELAEELGVRAVAGVFHGAVEHSFVQKGELHCEINLVFEMTIPGVTPDRMPAPVESHIEFLWIPLGALRAAHLEPAVLCELLPQWRQHPPTTPRWAGCGRFRPTA